MDDVLNMAKCLEALDIMGSTGRAAFGRSGDKRERGGLRPRPSRNHLGSRTSAADNEETAWRPSEGENVDEEEAAVPPERPVEEPDFPENRNAEHIQVVIDNLPAELDFDQRMAAKKFIRDRAGLFSKLDYDIGRTNLVQHVIDIGIHRPFKQPLRRHPLAHL